MSCIKKIINSFSQIIIIPNSLIVLDIDETLLTFDYKNNNTDEPIKLDNENLHKFMIKAKELKCDIIFLTARSHIIHNKTIKDLKKIGIEVKPKHIYYNKYKNRELVRIMYEEYNHIKDIIFVDNTFLHIKEVESIFIFTHFNLNLYLMKHDNI
jgi:predicted secreted acid phosphatase